jgi:hypothetical protein
VAWRAGGATVGPRDEPCDILSAVSSGGRSSPSNRTWPNKCVGTKRVLVPATYSPPRGKSELEFRIRDGGGGPRAARKPGSYFANSNRPFRILDDT